VVIRNTPISTVFPYTTLFRSVQYANKKFANTIESYGVTRSMSRKGNYWDNAVAESFFKSLKTELIYGNKLIMKQQMELEIFEYIEIWYNKKRRHRALNYKTIEENNNQNDIYTHVAELKLYFLFTYPQHSRTCLGYTHQPSQYETNQLPGYETSPQTRIDGCPDLQSQKIPAFCRE